MCVVLSYSSSSKQQHSSRKVRNLILGLSEEDGRGEHAHSPQKRRATGRATSSNQSSLGDTAVVAKAAQQVQAAQQV